MIAANIVKFSYVEKRYGMSDKYDVIIIGAGPGGIFSAYELMKKSPKLLSLIHISEPTRRS